MKYLATIFLILPLFLSLSARAELDDRKGFVYGVGLDFAPYAKYSATFAGIDLEKKNSAPGFQTLLGYSWNETNSLVLELHGTFFREKYELHEPYKIVEFDQTVYQYYFGPMWYHYYGKPGKAFFTALGAGSAMSESPWRNFNPNGFGVLVGAGGEFIEHWQVGVYFFKGSTSGSTTPDLEDCDLAFISFCVSRFEY
jgi:hypothetical protein